MQKKLSEASSKLQPLKQLRQEYDKKVAAKKTLDEILDKLNDAELEVEKAAIMSSVGADAQMADDEISAAMELLSPAQSQIQAATQLIERRMKGADGTLKSELQALQERTSRLEINLKKFGQI